MGGFLRDLSRMYLAPIMGLLFPDIIGINDVVDQHGFTVRYKHGEDLELKEHRDSSNATMNLCLGRPGFTGSSLYFREGQTSKTEDYSFNVGDAIFHKGKTSPSLNFEVSVFVLYLSSTIALNYVTFHFR